MVVNTYFQIITAINMKLTIFKDRNVDIIITDLSTSYEKIAKNLEKTKLFRNVETAKINEICYKISKFKKYMFLLFYQKAIKKMTKKSDYDKYDTMMFFNYDVFTFCLYNVLHKENKKIKIYRFEEGFCSYLHDFSKLVITNVSDVISFFRFRKSLKNSISKYYFYNPDIVLFKTKYELEKINNLDRNNELLRNALNTTFNYDNQISEYNKKFIFFEESFFCDNKGIDDLELILKIADIVGKENLLVKLHPRNKIDRFEKYGISTNKTIGIPWEVIQMNNDFSDKVFLTISSGSVLASRLYFNDNIKTYLLFNCTEKMSDMVTDKYFEYLDKVKIKFGLESFCIPNNKNEFFELLRKDVECERKSNK